MVDDFNSKIYEYFIENKHRIIEQSADEQMDIDLETILSSLIKPVDVNQKAKEMAITHVRRETPLYHVISNITSLRTIVISFLWNYAKENIGNNDVDQLIKSYNVIARTFDHYITVVTYEYQLYFNEINSAQKEAILELSTPIIPISDSIGVLPLVGDIDTKRAKMIREYCLAKSSDLGIEKLVIDLSGVPIVDTMVANELFQIEKGLRLLGIKAILTGIRPEIAQTAIRLGLDFSDLVTYSNLKQCLRNIL